MEWCEPTSKKNNKYKYLTTIITLIITLIVIVILTETKYDDEIKNCTE